MTDSTLALKVHPEGMVGLALIHDYEDIQRHVEGTFTIMTCRIGTGVNDVYVNDEALLCSPPLPVNHAIMNWLKDTGLSCMPLHGPALICGGAGNITGMQTDVPTATLDYFRAKYLTPPNQH